MVAAPDAASQFKTKLQEAAHVLAASLKGPASATAGEQAPNKQDLQTLSEGLKLEASKISLMWANTTPGPFEAESLLAGLEQSHSQLLTLLCRAGFGAGPTLLRSLQAAATPVTAACGNLIDFVSSARHHEGQVAVQTGKVWAACDAVSITALDNKTAIGRKLLLVSGGVKDNIREVQELISESQADEPSRKQSNGDDADFDLVDLDFETEALSAAEVETAQASLSLIQIVLDSLKLLVRVLLMEQDVTDTTSLDDWESLLFHAKGLADVSNDLAAGLFAPQDVKEVLSAADSLHTGCELVLDEIPERLQAAHAESFHTMAQRLADAHSNLVQILSVDVSALSL